MPTLTIEYRDESHRMALVEAIAYVSQLHQAAHDASSGTVLEACEKLALSDGRALLRSTLAAALEGRIALSEQRGCTCLPQRHPGAPRAGPAHGPDRRRPHHPETLFFLLPDLLARRLRCHGVLGIEGYVTGGGASRMACFLGVEKSFARAERTLAEVAGWELDDNTIRRLCHAAAAEASGTRERRTTAQAFARAEGDLELQIDAGKVNTLKGRDVKVAVFDRRLRGEPTTAEGWERPATCRPRRCARSWPPWRRQANSAPASPGRRSGCS